MRWWLFTLLGLYPGVMLILVGWTVYVVRPHVGNQLAFGWAWQAAVNVAAEYAAFFVVPIACAFMREAGLRKAWIAVDGGLAEVSVPAYRLPRWARWLETHDDEYGLLPGGTYEDAIRRAYERRGLWWGSVRWLWRNRAYRFSSRFAMQNTRRFEARDLGGAKTLIVMRDWERVPVAFELSATFRSPRPGKVGRYRAGWKLADWTDGDGLSGGATGILQTPSPRPFQSE